MADLNFAALQAVRGGSTWAPALLFATGVASSIGPCAVTRAIALASLLLKARFPLLTAAAFVGGTLAAYGLFGIAAGSVVTRLNAASSLLDAAVAATAIIGGALTVSSAHWKACDVHDHHEQGASIGVAFAAGAVLSLVVSPCCTPILAMVIALSAFTATPAAIAAMLMAFGAGHAAGVLAACVAGRPLVAWLRRSRLAQGAQLVAGTIMLVLGAYYALLV